MQQGSYKNVGYTSLTVRSYMLINTLVCQTNWIQWQYQASEPTKWRGDANWHNLLHYGMGSS